MVMTVRSPEGCIRAIVRLVQDDKLEEFGMGCHMLRFRHRVFGLDEWTEVIRSARDGLE